METVAISAVERYTEAIQFFQRSLNTAVIIFAAPSNLFPANLQSRNIVLSTIQLSCFGLSFVIAEESVIIESCIYKNNTRTSGLTAILAASFQEF